MACILKIPDETGKGILVFTTVERDRVLLKNSTLYRKIESLKKNWVIALHPNYFDHDYTHDPIFDFVFTVVDLLKSKTTFPKIDVQVHSLSPSYFKPSSSEKFWDILHVSRAQTSKNIPDFFKVIRKLYDEGNKYRVLLICTIPDRDITRTDHVYNIREIYDSMFSEKEKDIFTFLTTDYRQPYPFDTETIAHFYKSSKILLNSGGGERQGRINAYAWCCGMPVVSLDRMKDLIPYELRKEPIFYPGKTYDDLPTQVQKAIDYCNNNYKVSDFQEIREHCSETYAVPKIIEKVKPYYNPGGTMLETNPLSFNTVNLDRRIARHHGFGNDQVTIDIPISELVNQLQTIPKNRLQEIINQPDPEKFMQELPEITRGKNQEIDNSVYKSKRFVRALIIKLLNILGIKK